MYICILDSLLSATIRTRYIVQLYPYFSCGWCVRLTTLPPPCAVVMKSGKLNSLEPSGPFQACNGTDKPKPLLFHSIHDGAFIFGTSFSVPSW